MNPGQSLADNVKRLLSPTPQHEIIEPQVKEIGPKIHCPVVTCLYSKECGKHFAKKKYLNQHLANVHGEKTFSCRKCKKSFAYNGWRSHHEKTCGMMWQCHCGLFYSSKSSLLFHAKKKHPLTENMLNLVKVKQDTPVITRKYRYILPKPAQQCFSTLPVPTHATTSTAVKGNSISDSLPAVPKNKLCICKKQDEVTPTIIDIPPNIKKLRYILPKPAEQSFSPVPVPSHSTKDCTEPEIIIPDIVN